MKLFRPTDNQGTVLGEIALTDAQLLDPVYETLMMALDRNPSDARFAAAMQGLQALLGSLYEPWMTELKKIHTLMESEDHMNFILEDWITEWRIADFIDSHTVVARIESVPDPVAVLDVLD